MKNTMSHNAAALLELAARYMRDGDFAAAAVEIAEAQKTATVLAASEARALRRATEPQADVQPVEETRRRRLALLVNEYGTRVALARRANLHPSALTRWLPKKAGPRSAQTDISHKLARQIEAALNKPAGWMDQPIAPTEARA